VYFCASHGYYWYF
nr:immunoglobulin heavy chain junction region [Mus musculus]